MLRRHKLPAVILFTVLSVAGGYAGASRQAGDPFTLSAVVLDRQGQPVPNLGPSDFVVRENGKPVSLTAFNVMRTGDSAARGRSVTLILNGAGSDAKLTPRFQEIANAFMEHATGADEVTVVRMAYPDEAFGTPSDMRMRIAEFRAPYGEPFNAKTQETVLDRIAKVARDMSAIDARRRAIVCIGPSDVFDVREPEQRQYELLWPHWVAALNATARANVSVYVIDPTGLTGRVRINPDGLVAQTGGAVMDNSNLFETSVDRVWRETGNYYALEYVSPGGRRDLQSIEVKVGNRDVTVRARRSR